MYNKVTLWALFVVVLYSSFSTWRVYQKQKESQAFRGVVEKKVQELEERDREIMSKIGELDTEQGMEREIRGKFNVSRENENMVVILEEENSTSSSKKTNLTIWDRFLNLFRR